MEIGEDNFKAEVLLAELPVMVGFWAPWSQPCRIIRSVMEEVARRCAGKIKILEVNVDNHPDLGMWYDIQSTPTFLCFVNGEVLVQIVGTASKEAILSKLKPYLTEI